MKINSNSDFIYPEYMNVIYEGIYDDDVLCEKMDNLWNCQLRTFLQYRKLVNTLTYELSANQKVCQMGVVFGNQIDETALAIGAKGQYLIVDINDKVIKRASNRCGKLYKNLEFIQDDAATMNAPPIYDAVICFLLLSMVPKKHKELIIDNALKMIVPGGKAIFIDWHKPSKLHPLYLPTKLYNRLHHPFVEQLWNCSIQDMSTNNSKAYKWKTETFFGGMFQKTTVLRIADENNGGYNFSFAK